MTALAPAVVSLGLFDGASRPPPNTEWCVCRSAMYEPQNGYRWYHQYWEWPNPYLTGVPRRTDGGEEGEEEGFFGGEEGEGEEVQQAPPPTKRRRIEEDAQEKETEGRRRIEEGEGEKEKEEEEDEEGRRARRTAPRQYSEKNEGINADANKLHTVWELLTTNLKFLQHQHRTVLSIAGVCRAWRESIVRVCSTLTFIPSPPHNNNRNNHTTLTTTTRVGG